jgi:hypothetical protein
VTWILPGTGLGDRDGVRGIGNAASLRVAVVGIDREGEGRDRGSGLSARWAGFVGTQLVEESTLWNVPGRCGGLIVFCKPMRPRSPLLKSNDVMAAQTAPADVGWS